MKLKEELINEYKNNILDIKNIIEVDINSTNDFEELNEKLKNFSESEWAKNLIKKEYQSFPRIMMLTADEYVEYKIETSKLMGNIFGELINKLVDKYLIN